MREVIYKGATRPPMKWGVPLLALVAVFMPSVLLVLWATLAAIHWVGRFGLLAAPTGAILIALAFIWMRWMTARDDQRLTQITKSLVLQIANRNRALFQNRSYGAYRARGARDAWRR